MDRINKKKLKEIISWLQNNQGRNLLNSTLVVDAGDFLSYIVRNHSDKANFIRYLRRNYEDCDTIRIISVTQILEKEFNAKIVVNDKTGKIVIPKKGNWVGCYQCQRTVKKKDSIHVVGHGDFCKECHKQKFKTCDECKGDVYDGDLYTITPHSDRRRTHNKVIKICRTCFKKYPKCPHCDHRFYPEDIKEYIILSSQSIPEQVRMCVSCFNHNYTQCYVCGGNVHNHRAVYRDDDHVYCRLHAPERDINDWSYKPEPKWGKIDAENTELYYGIELEIGDGGNSTAKAKKLRKLTDDFYIKNDSSVHSGFEIVTHPCTYRYHMEIFPWKDVLKKAKDLGYTSDNSSCGIHIHVSKVWFGELESDIADENIAKLLTLTQKNLWDDVYKFSRRNERSMRQWARRYQNLYNPMELLNEAKQGERHSSVNLRNTHTIEFRIFKGTLNYANFIANIQLIRMLCEMSISLDERSIERTTWPDVVQYAKMMDFKEFLQYCKRLKML